MRERRAVIFSSDIIAAEMLKRVLHQRGYEILSYQAPYACPLDADGESCTKGRPCSDVMFINFNEPSTEEAGFLASQSERECSIRPGCKGLITPHLDSAPKKSIEKSGFKLFEKPLDAAQINLWLDACEQHMNLSEPLAVIRQEHRRLCNRELTLRPLTRRRIYKGITINRSQSGLCLMTTIPLSPDQKVTVFPDHPRFSRSAFVRWIRGLGSDCYLVGLRLARSRRSPFTRTQSASHP